jgi:hypothetical protein
MYFEPQVRWMDRRILRTSLDILAARAKGVGLPSTPSRATFFYQLQASDLIQGGMGATMAAARDGAREAGPQTVLFSGILPGFDLCVPRASPGKTPSTAA